MITGGISIGMVRDRSFDNVVRYVPGTLFSSLHPYKQNSGFFKKSLGIYS